MNSGMHIHNRARNNVINIMLTQVVGRKIRVMLRAYLDMTSTGNDRV